MLVKSKLNVFINAKDLSWQFYTSMCLFVKENSIYSINVFNFTQTSIQAALSW